MTPLQLSRLIADAAADKKAREIVRLDIRQKSSIADYFVICEGDTDRQVRAITDSIIEKARTAGIRPLRTSGYQEGSWVVLDYASVIVHVFLPGERSYYDLESLWKAPARLADGNGSPRPDRQRGARDTIPPIFSLRRAQAMPDKGKSKSGGAKKKGGKKK